MALLALQVHLADMLLQQAEAVVRWVLEALLMVRFLTLQLSYIQTAFNRGLVLVSIRQLVLQWQALLQFIIKWMCKARPEHFLGILVLALVLPFLLLAAAALVWAVVEVATAIMLVALVELL